MLIITTVQERMLQLGLPLLPNDFLYTHYLKAVEQWIPSLNALERQLNFHNDSMALCPIPLDGGLTKIPESTG